MRSDPTHSKLTVVGDVDTIGRQAVEALLSADVCRSVCYVATTQSTNSLALADLQQSTDFPRSPGGDSHLPRLYLSDLQTAGRGRHGRSWISSTGTLTFSLIVSSEAVAKESARLLSLAVGVGVARAIEFHFAPLGTRLKWPNDVYIDGGKVAGILIETTQTVADHVVIGVGININQTPQLPESSTVASPRSIAQCVGRTLERYRLLESFVTEIIAAIQDLSPSETLAEFRARCLLTGQTVTCNAQGGPLQGECCGISDEGELLVQTPGEMHRCSSGEAQLVRIQSI